MREGSLLKQAQQHYRHASRRACYALRLLLYDHQLRGLLDLAEGRLVRAYATPAAPRQPHNRSLDAQVVVAVCSSFDSTPATISIPCRMFLPFLYKGEHLRYSMRSLSSTSADSMLGVSIFVGTASRERPRSDCRPTVSLNRNWWLPAVIVREITTVPVERLTSVKILLSVGMTGALYLMCAAPP
jgi:hypothetical protein